MNNLFLPILTPHSLKFIDKCHRYGHVKPCGSSIKNDTYKPIDWIYIHCSSQYWPCAFCDRRIKMGSLVMWQIMTINKSWRTESTKREERFEERWVEIQSKSSHTTNFRIEIGDHKDTRSIGCCNGCLIQSIRLGVIFKTWYKGIEITISLAYVDGSQWMKTKNVQK